ncbi:hypothetical protein ACFQET_02680 [Levilactobacillus tangyuanensis]|uniref:Integral membrane protein n=1 Tax=Levilactobacillus tangyuanensis TaxID=2486021 RepID=A0ABW1TKM6_9LACO|nr:hypothetical protein [Levilactobacillus tangyuanensis]
MRVSHRLTFLEFFGYLALFLGIGIQLYALISHPGSRVSGDDMFGGAVVLCLAIAFIHSGHLLLNLILIGLSGLGFGYFTFIHTQSWWWTVILAVATVSFLIYLLDLRGDTRRRQSNWFHF